MILLRALCIVIVICAISQNSTGRSFERTKRQTGLETEQITESPTSDNDRRYLNTNQDNRYNLRVQKTQDYSAHYEDDDETSFENTLGNNNDMNELLRKIQSNMAFNKDNDFSNSNRKQSSNLQAMLQSMMNQNGGQLDEQKLQQLMSMMKGDQQNGGGAQTSFQQPAGYNGANSQLNMAGSNNIGSDQMQLLRAQLAQMDTEQLQELQSMIMSDNQRGGMIMNENDSPSQSDGYNSKLDMTDSEMAELQNMLKEKGYNADSNSAIEIEESQLQELLKIIMLKRQPNGGDINFPWKDMDHQMNGQDGQTGTENMDMGQLMKMISSIPTEDGNAQSNINPRTLKMLTKTTSSKKINKILQLMQGQSQLNEPMYPTDGYIGKNPKDLANALKLLIPGHDTPHDETDANLSDRKTMRPSIFDVLKLFNKPKQPIGNQPFISGEPQPDLSDIWKLLKPFGNISGRSKKYPNIFPSSDNEPGYVSGQAPYNWPGTNSEENPEGRNPHMSFYQQKTTTTRPSISKMFFNLFTPKYEDNNNNLPKTESFERPYNTRPYRPHYLVESTTRPSLIKIYLNPKDRPNEESSNLPLTQLPLPGNGWYHERPKYRPNAPNKPGFYNRPGYGRNHRPKYNPKYDPEYTSNDGLGYDPNTGPGYNANNGPRYIPNHQSEPKHPFAVKPNNGKYIITNPKHVIQLNRTVPSGGLPYIPLIHFKPSTKPPGSANILNRVLQYLIDKNKYKIIDGTTTKQPIIIPLKIGEPDTDPLKKIIISPYPSVYPTTRPSDVDVYFAHDDDQLIVPPYNTHAIDSTGRPVSPEWQPLIDKAVYLAHHLFPNRVADVQFMPDSIGARPNNPGNGNLQSIPEMIKSFISGDPSNPYELILPTTDKPKYPGEGPSSRFPSFLKPVEPRILIKNRPSLLNSLMNLLRSESPLDDSFDGTPYLLEPWTPSHNKPKHGSLLDNILSLLDSRTPTEDRNEDPVYPQDSGEDPLWPSTSRKPLILTQILTLFEASDILWHPLQNTNKNLMDYLQPLLESNMLPTDGNRNPFYTESPENFPSNNSPLDKLINPNNRQPSMLQSILDPLLRSSVPNYPTGSSPINEIFNPNKKGPSLLESILDQLLKSSVPNYPSGSSPINEIFNPNKKGPSLLESILDTLLRSSDPNYPSGNSPLNGLINPNNYRPSLLRSILDPLLKSSVPNYPSGSSPFNEIFNPNKKGPSLLESILDPLLRSSVPNYPSGKRPSLLRSILDPFLRSSDPNYPSDNSPLNVLINPNNKLPSLLRSILDPWLRSSDPNYPSDNSPLNVLINPNNKLPSLLRSILDPLLRSSDPNYPSDNSPLNVLINPNNKRPSLLRSILDPLLKSSDPNYPSDHSPLNVLINPENKRPSLLRSILDPLLRSSDPNYPSDNSPLNVLINPENKQPSLLRSILDPLLKSSDPNYPSDNSPLNVLINPENKRPSLLQSILDPLLRSSDPNYPSDNSPLNVLINPNNKRPSLLRSIFDPLLKSSDPNYPSDNSPLNVLINPENKQPSLLRSILDPFLRSSDPNYPSDNSPLNVLINPNNKRPSLLQSILDPLLRSSDPNYPSDNSPLNVLINPENKQPSLLRSILDPLLKSSDPNYPSDNSPLNVLINPENKRPSLLQSILEPLLRSSDPNYPSDNSPLNVLINPNNKRPSLLRLILDPFLRSSDPNYPSDNSPLNVHINPNNKRPSLLRSILDPFLRSSDPNYPSGNSPLNVHINPNNKRPSLLRSILDPFLRSSDPNYPSDNSPLNVHINPSNKRPSLLRSILDPFPRSSDPNYPSGNSPLNVHINPNNKRPSLLRSILDPFLRSSDPNYPSDNSPLNVLINPNNKRPTLLQSILDPFPRSSDPNYPSGNSPLNVHINPNNKRPSLLRSILDPFLRSSDPNYPSDNSPLNGLINPNNRRPSLLQSILDPFLRTSDPNSPFGSSPFNDSFFGWPDLWHLIPQLDKDPKNKHKSILVNLLRILQSDFETIDEQEILNVIKDSEPPMDMYDILWPKRLLPKLLPDTVLPTWERFVQLTNFAPTALTGVLLMFSSGSSSTDPWDDTPDKPNFGDTILSYDTPHDQKDRPSLSNLLTSSVLYDDYSPYNLLKGIIPTSSIPENRHSKIIRPSDLIPDLLSPLNPSKDPWNRRLYNDVLSILYSSTPLSILDDSPFANKRFIRTILDSSTSDIDDIFGPTLKPDSSGFDTDSPYYSSKVPGSTTRPSLRREIFSLLGSYPSDDPLTSIVPEFGILGDPLKNPINGISNPRKDLRSRQWHPILDLLIPEPKDIMKRILNLFKSSDPEYPSVQAGLPDDPSDIFNGPRDKPDPLFGPGIPTTNSVRYPLLPKYDLALSNKVRRPSFIREILSMLYSDPEPGTLLDRMFPSNQGLGYLPKDRNRPSLTDVISSLLGFNPNRNGPSHFVNKLVQELTDNLGRPSTVSNIVAGLNTNPNQGNPLDPSFDFSRLLQLLKQKIADNPYGQITFEKLTEICNMLLKLNVKPSAITKLLGQPGDSLQRLRNLLQPSLSPTTKKYYPSIFPSPNELVAPTASDKDKLFIDLLESEPNDDLFPSLSDNSESPFTELKKLFKFYLGEPEHSSSLSETVRQFLTKLTTDPGSLRDDDDIKRDDRLINLIQKISTMNEPARQRIYDCLQMKSILPTVVAAEDEGINCDMIKLLVKLKFPQLSESEINDMIAQQVSSLMKNGRRQGNAFDHWSMLTKPEDLSMEYRDAIVE